MKRSFDLILSLVGIVLLSPFFVVVALLLKCESPGPVLFRHERVGKDFKPFSLLKFRTMVQNAASLGPSITSGADRRITRVGKVLRKTKVDELPQLINVLRGDISLVGPRPEVRKYVEMFLEDYKDILAVKPGITDYASIEFRDEEAMLAKYEDPEEAYIREILPAKIRLYKKYLKNKGFFTDLELLIKTLIKIIRY